MIRLTDLAVQTKTASGLLHIPDNAKKFRHRLMRRGRIVAIGGRVTLTRPDGSPLAPGDEVTFTQQSGYDVPEWPGEPHAERELRMVRQDDLEGVVEGVEHDSGGCAICGHARAEAAE